MKTRSLAWLAAVTLVLPGCPVPTSGDGDAGNGSLSIGPDGAIVTPTSQGATGAGCDVQTSGGAILCAAISLCPGLAVDPATFSDCGFRVRGDVIDIECECSGFLCPVGAPTTCAEAATLLEQQNSDAVCSHSTEGTCIQEAPASASTADAGTTTNTMGISAGCDQACESLCVSDPDCIEACGC